MCPQRHFLATRPQQCTTSHTSHPASSQCPRNRLPRQQTLGDFLNPITPAPTLPIPQPETEPPPIPNPTVTQEINTNMTPPATLLEADRTTPSQPPQTQQPLINPPSHQQPLSCNSSNDWWGDLWAIPLLATTFRIVSKNTGTINPQNLDMQAITNELIHLNASVFVAQETNIHWDPLTKYQIYQQCK